MLKFNFTTITPLHISNGEDLQKDFHYIYRLGEGELKRFFKLNPIKTAQLLAKNENLNFHSQYNASDIERLISKNAAKLVESSTEYWLACHKSFHDHINNPRANGRYEVKEFINSNGAFYIPGSSVKGALLTVLQMASLGINVMDAKIGDRVVFRDSNPIPQDDFIVLRTAGGRPEVALQCLKRQKTFSLLMTKIGLFRKDDFVKKLKEYNRQQLTNLLREVSRFKSRSADNERAADFYLRSLAGIEKMIAEDALIINLGFGGGSWFKINKGEVPMFPSRAPRSRGQREAAHTTNVFSLDTGLAHIGWCKLEIEEV